MSGTPRSGAPPGQAPLDPRAPLLRKLERAIADHHVTQVLRSVVDNLDRHDALRAASAIAFDAFLSLIPLVALAGHVLSRLHQSSSLVLDPLLRAAPPGVAVAVSTEVQRMAQSTVVAPLAVIGFIWVSSAGLSTAMGVFETIYGSTARPWYVRRAIAAGCVIGSLAVVPAVGAAGLLIATVSGSLGAQLVALTLPAGTLILLVSAFFRIAIAERPGLRRPVLPGAALTVALWAVVSALFSVYVARLARYTTFYGNLATAAIFLFWLWLLALALFIGGELNARLERERQGTPSLRPPSLTPSLRPPRVPSSTSSRPPPPP